LFDRSDYETGKVNPAVKIAYQAGAQPFFAQSGKSVDGMIRGTGIVSSYMISDFDGACAGGESFISGSTVPVPLNAMTPVCVFTAFIDDIKAAAQLFDVIEYRIRHDGIVIGTVANSVRNDLKTYVNEHFPVVRLELYGSGETDKDLFVIVPGSFVCRGMEPLEKANLPYWRISIEKLS
ncbi:MAG: hypothetical protein NC308_07075, partial [Clostridium sp.]|nr:hypothetical protein [Clostridium sp.]